MVNIDIICRVCGYEFIVVLKSARGVRCPKCRYKVRPNYIGSNVRINYDSDAVVVEKGKYWIGHSGIKLRRKKRRDLGRDSTRS